ncbi:MULTISPECIES: arylsulfatase [Actinomyces]|uniref:Arylsulfatase n=1 Tax=Actinomyces respiraculi TaxID=2744574 RepID=A0A7T0PVG6_9ACTO|nr:MULTISPECIES: arylsulfatase [Actinomyces]QPL04689.1 arylsulfatase [Actinomyces respiraculi]
MSHAAPQEPVHSGPAEAAGRPNVVIVCVDQWRGDCLSGQGHPDVETPYLDQLAGRGAAMTQAYSSTPTCVPARMSLMTGLSQGSHRRVGYRDGVEFDIETTLPRAFRDAGYQTQAIGKMHYWPERVRIGFDDVLLHDGYLHHSRRRERDAALYDDYLTWLREQGGTSAVEDYLDDGIECNSVVTRPWDKPERLHPTNWVASEAIRWLYRRDPTAPFLLYLSFHRPHAPYDPPQWAFDRYNHGSLEPPVVGDWEEEAYGERRRDWDPSSHVATYRERDVQRARAGYYGHMTHIDTQISRVLQAMGEFGVLENTYVVFVSDHGDMMGDHNLWRKGYPYEGSARIPFLVAGPDVRPGTHCNEIVELRDVMPTLLELAGVDVPDGVEGRSLADRLRGEEPGPWRDYLHGEHTLFEQSLQWIRWRGPAPETHDLKYVWWSQDGREQLFDLTEDPGECHDLAADPAAAADLESGRQALVTELTGREEGFVVDGRLVPGRAVSTVLTRPHPPTDRAR